ncbi:hypothetical protein [Variovorax sp. OV329]|uniref:hypothetical protein n=1 Tax=Variovorax sp. OV329 TaxID=1882825 RepID=UPI0008F38111|nr:hypothetical protein [Variovorax sp. OV329]SFM32773.1 hypothetical protein SAMN05444747_104320 [Variovorax sp. OV329]
MTAQPLSYFNEVYCLRFGFWLLCVPVIAWMLFTSPWIIFRRLDGRKERSIARAKKIGRWLLIMIVLYVAEGMVIRTLSRRDCTVEGGRSPGGLYKMEVCYMGGRGQDAYLYGLARLRLAKDGTVLAEAEFRDPSLSDVYWDTNKVIVGNSSEGAFIDLPPSWLDRLRAKLP